MERLEFLKETNPILGKSSDPWDWNKDGEVIELAKNMLKIMFEHRGIGLAAPQLGLNKRLFVMGNSNSSFICVNPEIISGTGSTKEVEGCLSFPGLWLPINRYEHVKVIYHDILGRVQEKEFSGIIARVFQHENDHLNGECFTKKASSLSLKLALKKRIKNLRGK